MNPFRHLTYADSLAYLERCHGDREAVVHGTHRYSYADVKRHSDLAAARLASSGLAPGDKITLLLPNRAEFLWYWFGAAQMGLVVVMMNTRLRREEIAYQLAQSDSRAVIVPGGVEDRDFLAELTELAPAVRDGVPGALASERLPELRHVIAIDAFSPHYRGVLDWSEAAGETLPLPPMETDPDSPALISYSSGTTALPKGAMITHCVWRKAHDIGDRVDLDENDCLYMAIPMFGSMASLNGVLPYLARGARLVIGGQFDAGACLRAIESERVTGIHLLPPTIKKLVEHKDFPRRDRSSLRIAYVLSIDATVLDTVADVIGVPGVMTGYGLTETTTVVSRNRWDDPRSVRHSTQGWALPDIEVRIVEPESLEEQPDGIAGEIWVRGYCTMLGYYKKPDQTARVLRADGWLRTGDLGALDDTGRVRFLGRCDDGYKSRGFNVSPEEIEQAINAHPAVALSSVVGVADPVAEQVGAAFVIAKPGQSLAADDLLSYLKPKLAGYKMPGHVFVVDDLPMTSGTGKVQKFKLREDAARRLGLKPPPGPGARATMPAGHS